MKVRCKKILSRWKERKDLGQETENLTVGKEYIVLAIYLASASIIYFQIETNCGQLVLLEAEQFDIITTYIPSNWEIEIKSDPIGSYSFSICPRNWSQAPFDFYKDITEISLLEEWRGQEWMPEAVSLYFQEKDLIFREEEDIGKDFFDKTL